MTLVMKVPYTNFAAKNEQIKRELMDVFEQVLDSGKYIQGPEVSEFEKSSQNILEQNLLRGLLTEPVL